MQIPPQALRGGCLAQRGKGRGRSCRTSIEYRWPPLLAVGWAYLLKVASRRSVGVFCGQGHPHGVIGRRGPSERAKTLTRHLHLQPACAVIIAPQLGEEPRLAKGGSQKPVPLISANRA